MILSPKGTGKELPHRTVKTLFNPHKTRRRGIAYSDVLFVWNRLWQERKTTQDGKAGSVGNTVPDSKPWGYLVIYVDNQSIMTNQVIHIIHSPL